MTPLRWFILWNALQGLGLVMVRTICSRQVSQKVKGMAWTWVSNEELLGWHGRVCGERVRWRAVLRWSLPVVVLGGVVSFLVLLGVVGWGMYQRPH